MVATLPLERSGFRRLLFFGNAIDAARQMHFQRRHIFSTPFQIEADEAIPALSAVAVATGENEIVEVISTAVLFRADMIARAGVRHWLSRHPGLAMKAMRSEEFECPFEGFARPNLAGIAGDAI